MKPVKYFSLLIFLIFTFFIGGCYTEIATQDSGYSNNNSQPDDSGYYYDSSSDSEYTYAPEDSGYYPYDYEDSSQTNINNYYYGYPSYSGYYGGNYPSYYFGFDFGWNWYSRNLWDPFYYMNWCGTCYYSYNPYWYWYGPGFYTSYFYNYPYYNYPYYYGGYYAGYYNYRHRSGTGFRLRNNDGLRDPGNGRGPVAGINSGAGTLNRTGRNQTAGTQTDVKRGNIADRNQIRSREAGRTTTPSVGTKRSTDRRNTIKENRTRIERNGRVYRRYYNPRYNANRNDGRRYERPQARRTPNQRSSGTQREYKPQQRNYNPSHKTYSAPRSYSPPHRTYSAPRSYNPPSRSYSPPSRSSGNSRGSSGSRNSGGRR